MLLGKSLIDENVLKTKLGSLEIYYNYCDSLIPEEFRHIEQLKYNQRYLCTLVLRKSERIPWDMKKDIIVAVMSETRVAGLTDSCIELSQLHEYISRDKMEKYKRRFMR